MQRRAGCQAGQGDRFIVSREGGEVQAR